MRWSYSLINDVWSDPWDQGELAHTLEAVPVRRAREREREREREKEREREREGEGERERERERERGREREREREGERERERERALLPMKEKDDPPYPRSPPSSLLFFISYSHLSS